MLRPSLRSGFSGCFLSLVAAMVLLSVGFGINYLVVTRTCPEGRSYELPSFAINRRVRCRNHIKLQDYSATFAISPDDLNALKCWHPFSPTIVWTEENEKEWRQNTIYAETEERETNLEKKAKELSSFWYKAYSPGDQPYEILVDTSDESEYLVYIEATFVVW